MKTIDERIVVGNYLKGKGLRCPYPDCDSTDIEGGPVEIDVQYATQECSCLKCNRSWDDIYTLTGADLHDPLPETGKEGR